MKKAIARVFASRRDESGASSVEYALLIAGIAAVVVVIVFALGPVVREAYDNTCDQIQTEQAAAECDDGGGA